MFHKKISPTGKRYFLGICYESDTLYVVMQQMQRPYYFIFY